MIYFVGAGSGAPDLITVRGAKLISEADTIVFAGSLVNPQVFQDKKESCQLFDSSLMTLEETHKVLLEEGKKGKLVVRLHTGDPSLYGAIQEQMTLLDAEGLDYQVVPGVSSFLAAAATLKNQFTVPDGSQTLIITRMAGRTPVPEGENMASLAQHGASMSIFLSGGLLNQLEEELLKGNYTKETPAALVYKASWPDEQVHRCTVGTLAETAEKAGINHLVQILVGDFLTEKNRRSKLYDPEFTTGFRKGSAYEN